MSTVPHGRLSVDHAPALRCTGSCLYVNGLHIDHGSQSWYVIIHESLKGTVDLNL